MKNYKLHHGDFCERTVQEISAALSSVCYTLAGIEAVESFYHSIGMPVNLKELGIEPTNEQMKEMAHRCALATGGQIGSAKVLKEEDMVQIYRMAR